MKFDVYCDESRPDLLCSKNPTAQYMVIGGLWLPTEDRMQLKADIHVLRDKHKMGGEFKWQKVSPSRIDFYCALMDLFMARGDRLRFRCITVEHEKVDLLRFHGDDQELGFYKFYYQMLHHWILDFNEYVVFCDFKSNRLGTRLSELQRCLMSANLTSDIVNVQATRSKESVLIQMADVLTGIAAARFNGSLKEGSAKWQLIRHLEQALGVEIQATFRSEQKFNVFDIDLSGGW
ncbi:MAG: hypothetical protein COB62_02505 [Piscirickettsiaceae bacterium]|nr:MAG: hypothetical protein COB62_02505 [Piscirickettsiaceae bacterium]